MVDEIVKTRLKVGFSLIFAILALLWIDHVMERALFFGLLVLVLTVFGLREYAILADSAGSTVTRKRMMVFGGLFALMPVLFYEFGVSWALDWQMGVFVLFFLSLVFPALSEQPSPKIFQGITASLFGLIYIAFLAQYMLHIRFLPEVGEALAFYTIVVAKGTDVFAFFTGKYFGEKKFIPHISPGKTLAGFYGGMAGAVLLTVLFKLTTSLDAVLPWTLLVPFAIVVGLCGVAGDLVESLIKRSAQIKDSAKLLPTFGGILDVIDSILPTAPVVYYGILAIQAFQNH